MGDGSIKPENNHSHKTRLDCFQLRFLASSLQGSRAGSHSAQIVSRSITNPGKARPPSSRGRPRSADPAHLPRVPNAIDGSEPSTPGLATIASTAEPGAQILTSPLPPASLTPRRRGGVFRGQARFRDESSVMKCSGPRPKSLPAAKNSEDLSTPESGTRRGPCLSGQGSGGGAPCAVWLPRSGRGTGRFRSRSADQRCRHGRPLGRIPPAAG